MKRYGWIVGPTLQETPSQEGGDRFRELFENASDFIYTIDLAGNVISINRAGETLTGYSRQELIGSNIGQVIASESLATSLRMLDQMVKTGSAASCELEIIAKDCRRIPIEVSARLIYQNGQAAGVHGIAREVGSRKQAERRIQQRAAHLEALNAIIAAADAAPDLPLLMTVAIDRLVDVMAVGMGGIWAGDHHVVRGLSPEIGAAIVEMVSSGRPRTATSLSVADWFTVSGDGLNDLGEKWSHIGVRASITVPIVTEGQCIGALALASAYPRPWTSEELALAESAGQQVATTAEGLRLFREAQQHARLMGRLVAMSETLNRPSSVAAVAGAIGQAALDLSGAKGGAVYLRGADGTATRAWVKELRIDPVAPRALEALPWAGPAGEEEPGQRSPSASTHEAIGPTLCPDVLALPQDDPVRRLAAQNNYRAAGLWPLTYEGRVIAGVSCYHEEPHIWSKPEKEVFQTFTLQAASALENARLYEAQVARTIELEVLHGNLEEAYIQMVLALARAIDARDAYTGDHSERLVALADAVARALGLEEETVQDIRWAALLHDIGKIGAPDDVLRKRGPLTEQEWSVMRRHPVVGEEILRPLDRMRGVAKIVRHHQEQWDGHGYPDGLRGEAIPLGARILAVVDAYSAMIDERSYKLPKSQAEAVAEIRRCAGTQFDPKIVDVFCEELARVRQEPGVLLPS